jgi:hypothetical protein
MNTLRKCSGLKVKTNLKAAGMNIQHNRRLAVVPTRRTGTAKIVF